MKKALGVLGGMGPQATVDFMQKIVQLTKAERDPGHLRVYVDSHPQIPDRISAVLSRAVDPLPAMLESLHKLESCGASCIAMPCVTAHYFLPQLREKARAELLDMLEIAALVCDKQYPGQTAGVLSSVATAQSGVFTRVLEQHAIPYLKPQPADQEDLGRLILQVKAGPVSPTTIDRFDACATEMRARGADYFVLACTELPLIAQAYRPTFAFVDVTTELAKAAILACGYPLREEA